jgi:MFS family permease
MNIAMSWPFVRLYALTFLYFSANSILNVIVPLQGEQLGASNAGIGFIMGAYMLTCMVFRPWAGQLIQRYGPVYVLRVLLVVNGLALVIYTFAGLELMFAARLLQGASTAFFSMALQIGIMDALPEEERSQGVSLYSLFTYMPSILGPVIALGIWDFGGMDAFTLVLIGIAVVTGLFGYSIQMGKQQPVEAEAGLSEGKGWLYSLKRLATDAHMFTCSVIMLLASVVFGSVTSFVPLYANQLAQGNAGVYLMLQAAAVVLARFLLRKRIPSDGKWHTPLIVAIAALIAVAAQLLALSESYGVWPMYAAAIIMGVAQALLYPTLMTYLSFALPLASRNVQIGLFIAMADLGISLGGIAMGPLADATSYSTMYTCCACVGVVAAMFAWSGGYRLNGRGHTHKQRQP